MRILKTLPFAKDAKAQGLSDESLTQAIEEVKKGLVDAELGGSLIKKRIAVGNKGKSGGLRTILVFKSSDDNLFCIYLFAKNETENISAKQLKQLKKLAKALLEMNEDETNKALKAGQLQEVILHEEQTNE